MVLVCGCGDTEAERKGMGDGLGCEGPGQIDGLSLVALTYTGAIRMRRNKYEWCTGLERRSDRGIESLQTVTADTVLIDLFNGDRHLVYAMCDAGPDSIFDQVMRTVPAGSTPEDELNKLRAEVEYTPDEFCGPRDHVVFCRTTQRVSQCSPN